MLEVFDDTLTLREMSKSYPVSFTRASRSCSAHVMKDRLRPSLGDTLCIICFIKTSS